MNIADQMRKRTKEAVASQEQFMNSITQDAYESVLEVIELKADQGRYSVFISEGSFVGYCRDRTVDLIDFKSHMIKRLEADRFYIIRKMDGFIVDWDERILIPRSLEASKALDVTFSDK